MIFFITRSVVFHNSTASFEEFLQAIFHIIELYFDYECY